VRCRASIEINGMRLSIRRGHARRWSGYPAETIFARRSSGFSNARMILGEEPIAHLFALPPYRVRRLQMSGTTLRFG